MYYLWYVNLITGQEQSDLHTNGVHVFFMCFSIPWKKQGERRRGKNFMLSHY